MAEVRVCRICLAMDVPLQYLLSNPIELHFETVTGFNLLVSGLPAYACGFCIAYIKKFHAFREKCEQSQNILFNILNTVGAITHNSLNKVNRDTLKPNLSVRKPADETFVDIVYSTINLEIKYEPNELDDQTFVDYEDIKVENDYDDFMSISKSSDDEPLSLHKSKTKKSKKMKSKHETGDIFVKTIEQEIVKETDEKPKNTTIEQKRKRNQSKNSKVAEHLSEEPPLTKMRRTQNTGGVKFEYEDEDVEEFATVIKLTIEEQLEEIQKRKTSKNYLNSRFQCNLCYKGFIDDIAWKHHLVKHDPKSGDIECRICKFRFKLKRSLHKHVTIHEMKYQCKACPFVSLTPTQAKQHQRWHKGVTYKCQYCDEVSTKWTSYLSHVRIKHRSEHVCGICGYSFVSKLGLRMHRSMMHKQESSQEAQIEKPECDLYCSLCDVKFESTEAWKRHLITSAKHVNAEHINGCRECGSSFANAEELRIHHRKEHPKTRPRNYGKKKSEIIYPVKCEHCPEMVENAREHWSHFRRSHPDQHYPIQKDHVCDVCGKSFRGNAFLVYHKRTHSEERSYKCAQCPKAFFNKMNLQMHEKSHSDNRPYPCTVCIKAFKSKAALDRHFRSHTGVKPYECEVCGKAFNQSNSRKLHVRTVHLKQPAPYVSKARQKTKKEVPPVVVTPCHFVYQ